MSSASLPEVRSAIGVAVPALARLVAWLRGMGPIAGAAAALLGVVLLTAADRLRRPVAVLGGAAVGALAARAAEPLLPATLSLAGWSWVLAVVFGGVAGLAPMLFPVSTGALVGALLGVHVAVAGRPWVGALVAGAVGAALLAVGARSVAVILACLGGGLAVVAGLVTLAGGRELGAELAARPLVMMGFAVVVGVAGSAFQLSGDKGRPRSPAPPRLPRD